MIPSLDNGLLRYARNDGSSWHARAAHLETHGLYHPSQEHDACGVGMVVSIDGSPRRDVVELGIAALKNVWHRGAVNADGKTGDGAGVHLQIPFAFFHDHLASFGDAVPENAPMGVGMIFLPRTEFSAQEEARLVVETEVLRFEYGVHSWRQVPVDPSVIGEVAQASRPEIAQLIVIGKAGEDLQEFEKHLYVIRRRIEKRIRALAIRDFYICSLSCRYIIYKGLFQAEHLPGFYPDLADPRFTSNYLLFHQRFSTNTAPSWQLAQPFRTLAHNGEINTLKGNLNWMSSYEASFGGSVLGEYAEDIVPVVAPGLSDTGCLDAVAELMIRNGTCMPMTKLFLIPPAWQHDENVPKPHKALFEYCNCLVSPWDGPAAIVATDGEWVLAGLDRNGLRPLRYSITDDGLLMIGSETGMVPRGGRQVIEAGRLGPGQMLGVNLSEGKLYKDLELKEVLAARHPYGEWVGEITRLEDILTPSSFQGEGWGEGTEVQQIPAAESGDLCALTPTLSRRERELWKPSPSGRGLGEGHFLSDLARRQYAAGYTEEDVELILSPMMLEGKEPIGSMGDDTPLAVLSTRYRGLQHFFRQHFSQVTNPPIDPLREAWVMSLTTRIGPLTDILSHKADLSRLLQLGGPVLLGYEYDAVKAHLGERIAVISTHFAANGDTGALRRGIDAMLEQAEASLRQGCHTIVLTDETIDRDHAAIPTILAAAALHSHMTRKALRKQMSLIVKASDVLDVHSLAVLIGVGATAVYPYLAEATVRERCAKGLAKGLSLDKAVENYRQALTAGLTKVMSKMGISVLASYRGGRNFDAIGLSRSLVAEFFPGLISRISGIGLRGLEQRILERHRAAWAGSALLIEEAKTEVLAGKYAMPATGDEEQPAERDPQHDGMDHMVENLPKIAADSGAEARRTAISTVISLPIGGFYKYRTGGEVHGYEGEQIHLLQSACAKGRYQLYKKFAQSVYDQAPISLRAFMAFRSPREPIPLDQVEPVTEIRKRFVAPAMSLGALSPEAHRVLAIAMNRIGAMSNSGEGGEGAERYRPDANGDNANSTIKQVASARFGVTAEYLNAASELQIKVAQGAKPGEGGQLPGFKVTVEIARLRHATPGVSLISPPPHHDIYSIEDLGQLIFDLKQINPHAIVSVKLVAQSGIGTIASGVAKAMADKICISGHVGGTGAAGYSSIKHAGAPWEMGLAEANQVLSLNGLRHRVILQTDGGLKTGRDIVIAALLGAEEYGIGTLSLVAMGCLLVRQCHSNTCPVGICTQDEKLREHFTGTVDKVIQLMSFIAEEVREILAKHGFRSLDEIIGHTELLHQVHHGSADLDSLDLGPLLTQALSAEPIPPRRAGRARNEVPDTLDQALLSEAEAALERGERIERSYTVHNTDRTIGARLSSLLVRHFAGRDRHDDHITLRLRGSAGQSLGAFGARGLKIEVLGDANDYVGKGLSGATLILRPPPSSRLVAKDNTIIGNTVLYGATSGSLFAAGQAGERFAVRNSGAVAVIEGCGSNACEYMTGGTVAILGAVGNNFGAGMTGGMSFAYDEAGGFESRVNPESVVYRRLASDYWENELKSLLEAHVNATESVHGWNILSQWDYTKDRFWQICPKEMLRFLVHPLNDDEKTVSHAG